MKIGLLTSNEPRHKYFMSKLLSLFDIEAIIVEPKKKNNLKIRKKFLKSQRRKEKLFFEKKIIKNKKKIIIVKTNQINSVNIFNKLKKKKLDLLIVFGTSILNENIYKLPKYSSINLHTGLLPEYRGVDSVIWAFKNNDFKNIGFTIHHIDKGIDTGPYISRKKVATKKNENIHTVFFKVVVEGINEIIEIIKKNKFKIKKKNKLYKKGKLYLSKHLEKLEKDGIFLKKYMI